MMDPSMRASFVFLGDVSLSKSKQGIAPSTLDTIDAVSCPLSSDLCRISLVQLRSRSGIVLVVGQVASALAVCNAQNSIYTAYSEKAAPVSER